jgi:hypothetical protein
MSAPSIIACSIVSDSINVSPTEPWTVQFASDVPMNESTLNNDSLYVVSFPSLTALPGTVVYDSLTKTATVTTQMLPSKVYALVIGSILDTNGATLIQTIVGFRTGTTVAAHSHRAAILRDVDETLRTISTSNGYHTAIVTFESQPRAFADNLNADMLPYLGWMPRKGQGENVGCYVRRETQYVDVGVHILGADEATTTAALANLIDDVTTALLTDLTRSGLAIQTYIAEAVDTNEGDADAQDGRGGQLGTAVISFGIDYDYVMPH